jgi:hypothetical protein
MDMVCLNSQFEDLPPLNTAFLPDDLFAIFCYKPLENRFSSLRAPDQVIDNKMDSMFVSLIFHVDIIMYDNSIINT